MTIEEKDKNICIISYLSTILNNILTVIEMKKSAKKSN